MALVLCILGATNSDDPTQIESQSTIHIGVILFTVVFAALVALTGGAILGWRMTRRGEAILIVAVSCALPFLTVRIVYSLLAAFSHDSRFAPATGSTTIALCMETLQEMAVVLIYLIAQIKVPSVPSADDGRPPSAGSNLLHRAGRGDFGGRRSGLFTLATAAGQALGRRHDRSRRTGQRTHQEGYPLTKPAPPGRAEV